MNFQPKYSVPAVIILLVFSWIYPDLSGADAASTDETLPPSTKLELENNSLQFQERALLRKLNMDDQGGEQSETSLEELSAKLGPDKIKKKSPAADARASLSHSVPAIESPKDNQVGLELERLRGDLLDARHEIVRLKEDLELERNTQKAISRGNYRFREVGEELKATILADKADLRVGPSEVDSLVVQLDYGTQVEVDARNGAWYRVITPQGPRAWVHTSKIAFGPDNLSRPTLTIRIAGVDPEYDS